MVYGRDQHGQGTRRETVNSTLFHPAMARAVIADRVRDMQARADATRQVREARRARRAARRAGNC